LISRVDQDHGDAHPTYEKMRSPNYPTHKQIQELRQAAELPGPEERSIANGEFKLTLPADGLAVVELK
jgi:xylan 1,4-beta-xylosidase